MEDRDFLSFTLTFTLSFSLSLLGDFPISTTLTSVLFGLEFGRKSRGRNKISRVKSFGVFGRKSAPIALRPHWHIVHFTCLPGMDPFSLKLSLDPLQLISILSSLPPSSFKFQLLLDRILSFNLLTTVIENAPILQSDLNVGFPRLPHPPPAIPIARLNTSRVRPTTGY